VAYVASGPTSAVTEGRVLVHLRYGFITYNYALRVLILSRIHFFIYNFCRIMLRQMGWNIYVLIVVLRISRKNKVLLMGILKGQCHHDPFDIVSSSPLLE
jgi:hypothetical protein